MSGIIGQVQGVTGRATSAISGMTNAVGGLLGGGGTPPDQRQRPIAFILEDDGSVVEEVTLGLRPEDFMRTDQSRVTVHHTLGGAWADSFGPGLPSMTINGTTGWRGGADGDGEARWRRFRDVVYNGWHNRRKRALEEGRDPSKIKLIYADALSGFTVEVAPMALNLRRSRGRPLLIAYTLTMMVLDQNRDQVRFIQGGERQNSPGGIAGFFAAITGALDRIRNAINSASAWVQRNILGPVRSFLGFVNGVFSSVLGIVRSVRNLVGSVLAIPLMVAQAGTNLFRTLAAVANLPAQIKSDIQGVAGAFTTWLCFLRRIKATRATYGDYSAWYGASNCSSISGGRSVSPFAGQNPFYTLPLPSGASVRMSQPAASSMSALASSDPVLRPMPQATLATHLGNISNGAQVVA